MPYNIYSMVPNTPLQANISNILRCSHPAQLASLLQAQRPQFFEYCSPDTVPFIILLTFPWVVCWGFKNTPLIQGSVPTAPCLWNLLLNWL